MSNNDVTLKSLDEILTELKELETIPEDLADVLDAVECQRINKIDAIAYAINTLKYWIEIRKQESKRLAELAKKDEAKYDWLRIYLKESMESQGERTLKTKNFNLSIKSASQRALECDLPLEEVPEKYLKLSPTLNKTLLREDLEAGNLPPDLKANVRLKEKTTFVMIQ
jgi:hypothetical protein